jgi:hypothetical protein
MIEPTEREHWIDAPYPSSHSNTPLDEFDKALDALIDALKRADRGEDRGIETGLELNPAMSKIANLFASLPSSRVIALLERNNGDPAPSGMNAVLSAIVASGAVDRAARALLFRRITMAPRINALQRACDVVACQRRGAN